MARLNPGDLAYFDSFGGLIPCKVVSFDPETREAVATATVDRGGYRKGETIVTHTHYLICREHVVRRNGHYVIAEGMR